MSEESRVLVFCRFLECLKLKEKERKETKRKGGKKSGRILAHANVSNVFTCCASITFNDT